MWSGLASSAIALVLVQFQQWTVLALHAVCAILREGIGWGMSTTEFAKHNEQCYLSYLVSSEEHKEGVEVLRVHENSFGALGFSFSALYYDALEKTAFNGLPGRRWL